MIVLEAFNFVDNNSIYISAFIEPGSYDTETEFEELCFLTNKDVDESLEKEGKVIPYTPNEKNTYNTKEFSILDLYNNYGFTVNGHKKESGDPSISEFEEKVQSFEGTLSLVTLEMAEYAKDGIIYAYIINNGASMDPCKPVGETCTATIGILWNDNDFVDKGFDYMSQIVNNNCTIPQDFINHILQYEALNQAIASCDVPTVNSYWEKFNTAQVSSSNKCGCNG